MARPKMLYFHSLLTARNRLPLRPDDRIEGLLERFRVPFHAACTTKGTCQLQRGSLVFWLHEGTLHSLELTWSPGHDPSDLVDWCGFSAQGGDLLGWCRAQGIDLTLDGEKHGAQVWVSPSGALIALQDGALWNVTLTL